MGGQILAGTIGETLKELSIQKAWSYCGRK
jgi:hypothetical protein